MMEIFIDILIGLALIVITGLAFSGNMWACELGITLFGCLTIIIIVRSWFDCGSDHDEGGLTYPGDEKQE